MSDAWHPIKNPVDLKHLGKLAEELGEATSAAARCMIQGMDGINPHTGLVNKEWLENELSDVLANVHLVERRFNLDLDRMTDRIVFKRERLAKWHEEA